MFWSRKSEKGEARKEKLAGPQAIPGLVQKHLVSDREMDPAVAQILKAVTLRNENGQGGLEIRIFDDSEAQARKVRVADYSSLDEYPDLIIYEGWFDEGSKQVKLEERNRASLDAAIFTEAEILQGIESLKEPGSTVFYYMAAGSGRGGPLGMGAAVIELNPDYPGKRQKKYTVYNPDVVAMQPVGKERKIFGADKSKEIARWVKGAHQKRMY
jgi:hypothetical protein